MNVNSGVDYYTSHYTSKTGSISGGAIAHFHKSPIQETIMLDDIPCRYVVMLEPLALAYYQKGDKEKAKQEYEKIISLGLLRFGYSYIYVRSHYMLGKIHEDKGDIARAIDY